MLLVFSGVLAALTCGLSPAGLHQLPVYFFLVSMVVVEAVVITPLFPFFCLSMAASLGSDLGFVCFAVCPFLPSIPHFLQRLPLVT